MDSAADLGQDHEPQVFVLDMDGLPTALFGFSGNSIDKRQRVHPTTTALVNALFEKHRVQIGISGLVRQYLHCLAPRFHGTIETGWGIRKF